MPALGFHRRGGLHVDHAGLGEEDPLEDHPGLRHLDRQDQERRGLLPLHPRRGRRPAGGVDGRERQPAGAAGGRDHAGGARERPFDGLDHHRRARDERFDDRAGRFQRAVEVRGRGSEGVRGAFGRARHELGFEQVVDGRGQLAGERREASVRLQVGQDFGN